VKRVRKDDERYWEHGAHQEKIYVIANDHQIFAQANSRNTPTEKESINERQKT